MSCIYLGFDPVGPRCNKDYSDTDPGRCADCGDNTKKQEKNKGDKINENRNTTEKTKRVPRVGGGNSRE